jgi:hypothetical protein
VLVDVVDGVVAEAKRQGVSEKHSVSEICRRLSKRGPWRDYKSGEALETLYYREKKKRHA